MSETNHPINEVLQTTMNKIREMVDANTVVGQPITTQDGVTLIPVSKLSFGFATGGSDFGKAQPWCFGGGAGAGVSVFPVAFLVVKDGMTRVLPVAVPPVSTVDRIVDSFPSDQQAQVRIQLSMVLNTVVSQQLIPGINGSLVPAFEVMHVNSGIRSLIRDSKSHQIDNAIAAGGVEGMVTMDQSLLNLYRDRRIDRETAMAFSDNPEQMRRRLG